MWQLPFSTKVIATAAFYVLLVFFPLHAVVMMTQTGRDLNGGVTACMTF